MTEAAPLLSLVIPTYNEASTILTTLEDVERSLQTIPHEIIVVDDDSPDLTWQRVGEFAKSHPNIRIHRRQADRGLSAAVLDGFDQAKGDILGVMDADGSHDETILPMLYQKIREGAELAVGSRRIPGGGATEWPWIRRSISSFATWISQSVVNHKINDTMSGYFLLPKTFLATCRKELHPTGYKILIEISVRGKAQRIVEVPYLFKDRRQGYSKLSGKVIVQYLQQLVMLRFS